MSSNIFTYLFSADVNIYETQWVVLQEGKLFFFAAYPWIDYCGEYGIVSANLDRAGRSYLSMVFFIICVCPSI